MDPQQNSVPQQDSRGPQFVVYNKPQPVPPPVGMPTSVYQPPVPPVSAVPPMPPRAPMKPPHRHPGLKKALVAVIIIVVVLIIAACVAYALVLTPSRGVPQAFGSVLERARVHADVSVSVESTSPQYNGSSFKLSIDIDRTDPKNLLDQFTLDLAANGFVASAKTRIVDKTIYGELITVPSVYQSYVAQYLNKWYSITLATLQTYASSTGANMPADIGSQNAQMYSDLQTRGVFTGEKFLGIGQGAHGLVRRYEVDIDRDALNSYIQSNQAQKYGSSVAMTLGELERTYGGVTISPVIITSDLYSGQLQSVSEDVNMGNTLGSSAGNATLHILITYSDMPAGLSIVAPAGATPLDTLLTDSLAAAQNKGKDARVIADVQNLRTQLEIDYDGRSYATVKSANTIPSTGNYALLAQDAAKMTSVLKMKTNAYAPFTAYAVYGRLVSDPTKYFCLDSTGQTQASGPAPTSSVCR